VIVVGSNIYYSIDTEIFAQDLETGELIWRKNYSDISDELSTPAFAYGNIYLQVGDHSDSKLVCLSHESGETVWETPYSVQWSDLKSPVIKNGIVYIVEGYYSTTIGAYDAFDGVLKWKNDISSDNFDDWNPALTGDLIIGNADNFGALEAETGRVVHSILEDELPFQWSGWSGIGSPVIDLYNNQVICVTSKSMYALDLTTYEINWVYEDGQRFTTKPALSQGKLYYSHGSAIFEMDAATGTILYINSDYDGDYNAVVNDYVAIFSDGKKTFVFDRFKQEVVSTISYGGHLTLTNEYLIISAPDDEDLVILSSTDLSPPLSGNLNLVKPISCYGQADGAISINMNSTGTFVYNWSDIGTIDEPRRENLSPGNYSVTVTDEQDRKVSFVYQLTEPEELLVSASTSPEFNMNNNGSLELKITGGSPPYSISWSDFPDITDLSLSNLSAGTYMVNVTDSNNCSIDYVVEILGTSDVNDLADDKLIKLHPNPTSGKVSILIPLELNISSYQLLSPVGEDIKSGIVKQNILELDLTSYASGLYVLQLESPLAVISKKILLIK